MISAFHHGSGRLPDSDDESLNSSNQGCTFVKSATRHSTEVADTDPFQELAFLTDASVITPQQLSIILTQLPQEKQLNAPIPLQSEPPTGGMANLTVNDAAAREQQQHNDFHEKKNSFSEKQQTYHHSPALDHAQPPPAYPTAPAPPAHSALTYAISLYVYAPTDAGDLALQPNDRVAITEYMNAEWWKGRSERTGQEGIFPRSYVRTEDKFPVASPPAAQPPSGTTNGETQYGNMPMAVSQSGGQASGPPGEPNKIQQQGKKFGKKMGNAAIFGAGATVGSNIVNSIF